MSPRRQESISAGYDPLPAVPPEAYYRPLCPEARDQGDPYVLHLPPSAGARFRFYTYVTGVNSASGKAFRAYGSDDLVHWRALGETLEADGSRDHWAPCVQYLPHLPRPYVMLYSRAIGLGPEGHIGHTIRRADSTAPEGPFTDSGHILTPDDAFAIDPDVYRRPDGSLYLGYATDFILQEPLGTGLVEAKIDEDLTALLERATPLARASYSWQVYDAKRRLPWMEIPGINWETDTVVWHTVEGLVGGLRAPQGDEVYLYSGGNFSGFYAIGALVRHQDGRIVDVAEDEDRFVLRPRPERAFFGPGHCSLVRGAGAAYIMFHARYGAPDAPRQMGLAPLSWTEAGIPYAPWPAPPPPST
jgi:hypothetical protein